MDISAISKHKKTVDDTLTSYLTRKKMESINELQSDLIKRLIPFVTSGKSIRGCLVVFGHSLFSKTEMSTIFDAAASLELIHSGLLIHDDIMDRDELRRGKQAMYTQYTEVGNLSGATDSRHFGISMGINAADFCFFTGFELLGNVSNDILGIVSRELTNVVAAQMQDVYASQIARPFSEEDILTVYRYKTARYTFSLPLTIGARLAAAPDDVVQMLDRIGENIGIIFQLRDDELNLMGNAQKTGKPQGSDIREHKQTLLSLYMSEDVSSTNFELLSPQEIERLYVDSGARKRVSEKISNLVANVSRDIQQLPIDAAQRSTLQALAEFVQTRQN